MKIGIIGDLHIAPVPANRLDDYFQVGLNKIEEIAKKCDVAIFLGDIFSTPRIDEEYVRALIKHLRYCKSLYNVEFKTIIGNHDVAHEDENNIDKSSLGILECSGVMDLITPENPCIIQNYCFHTIPVNYKKAQQYLNILQVDNNYNNILLVHHEYETGTNCFNYDNFRNLGCYKIFLGHDHKPLDKGQLIYPEFTAYRSGSIMRNRADDYNFTRQLYYYILEDGEVHCEPVTTSLASSIFKIEAITRQNYEKEKFVESVNEVIEKYKNNIGTQSRFSIKNILVELGATDIIIDKIKKRHEKIGERFE